MIQLIGKIHPQFWVDDVYLGLLVSETNLTMIDIRLAHYAIPYISL